MAAINDLIRQIEDKYLRDRLQQEVARLSKQKKFGLVFEDHIPECTPLYGVAVRKGSLVAVKGEDIRDVYFVSAISDGRAAIVNKATGEKSERPLDMLVAVAQFGEPIFPSLIPIDSVENTPDSNLWHTLIEADNFHALQLLEYLYPKQVDCIYIDPPYNSRAKDWKYNNDYVDPTDSYRHSKWLSMMQRRLKIAKRILNPQNSVLIVTIDEKEYLHLGCLLEDMFPEAHIQMVSSVINPKGSARDGFSRSDEYIFFVMFGECTPARLPLSNEWSSSAIVSAQEKTDDDEAEKSVEPGWTSMMRRGTDSMRTDSPNLYYPIYVDPDTRTIKEIGTSIPMGQDRAEEIPGLIQVLPLRRNGTQGRWQVGNVELKNRIQQGRVRLGRPTAYGFVINYLPDGEYAKVVKGEYAIQGYADDGSMIAYKKELGVDELRMPPTQWKIASHNASENGTTLLTSVIGEKRFPFPKSLYAVRDTLRFFVADKPNALIVDFFAGSGTTLHAVNLLNAEDGGNRRCILVTNNEVSDDEAKTLKKQGYQPGDEEWEKLGIARYVTWPRTVCSIKGVDINGDSLKGNYGCEIEKMVEVDGEITDPDTGKKLRGTFYKKAKEAIYPTLSKIKMADGFAANAEYFKLGFLDKSSVELGASFKSIIPMLWLQSGAVGKCPELSDEELPEIFIPENGSFAVLLEEYAFSNFKQALKTNPNITHVYIVTDSHIAFREMASQLTVPAVKQLYRDYIDNFTINARRNNI